MLLNIFWWVYVFRNKFGTFYSGFVLSLWQFHHRSSDNNFHKIKSLDCVCAKQEIWCQSNLATYQKSTFPCSKRTDVLIYDFTKSWSHEIQWYNLHNVLLLGRLLCDGARGNGGEFNMEREPVEPWLLCVDRCALLFTKKPQLTEAMAFNKRW